MRVHVLLALLLPLVLFGQARVQEPLVPVTWSFGLSLGTGAHSQIYSLFLVKEKGMEILSTEPLSREQFVKQAQGRAPSKANPTGEDLFRTYGVEGCVHPDTSRFVYDCDLFDELWKLRFWEYPFQPKQGAHHGRGWSERREGPSPRQMLLLSDYGILYISGLARGENAFRLLRDISDSTWVDNYRKGY